jgi:SAM-dependent methyltransferase
MSTNIDNKVVSEISSYIKSVGGGLYHYITNGQYERLTFTAHHLENLLKKSDNILDIGSFPYFIPAYLSLKGFHNINTIEIPRSDDFQLSPNWNFNVLRLDIEEVLIPLDENSVDAVLLLEVFEHLYRRPNQVFRELRRILKPNGKLVLSTPNGAQLPAYIKAIMRSQFGPKIFEWSKEYEAIGHFSHIREYSLQEIKEYISNFDFSIERAYRIPFFQLDNPYSGGSKKIFYSAYRSAAKVLRFLPIMQNNIYLVATNNKPA